MTFFLMVFVSFIFFVSFVSAVCGSYAWEVPKSAEVSTFEEGFGAEKAFDEDARTHWKSKEKSLPQWIAFDLGERGCVRSIEVYVFRTYGPIEAEIQISDDGTRWGTIKEVALQSGAYQKISFREAPARFIRIYQILSVRNFGTLSEIKVEQASIEGPTVFILPFSISGKKFPNGPPRSAGAAIAGSDRGRGAVASSRELNGAGKKSLKIGDVKYDKKIKNNTRKQASFFKRNIRHDYR